MRRQASNKGTIGFTETVSIWVAPIACSISTPLSVITAALVGEDITSKTIQAESIDLAKFVRKLPVILDYIDEVGRGEQPCKC
jgi:hypothetical protein